MIQITASEMLSIIDAEGFGDDLEVAAIRAKVEGMAPHENVLGSLIADYGDRVDILGGVA